jgi:hypothetical protein
VIRGGKQPGGRKEEFDTPQGAISSGVLPDGGR